MNSTGFLKVLSFFKPENCMKTLIKNYSVPIALFILSALSFGVLIPRLGFYWDDWPYLAIYRLQGMDGFRQFFESDRPTTFISYILLMPVLGTNPVGWQIFTLSLRWLCGILIWWFLRRMWPEKEDLAILSALLFVVYPVFRQQSIALTYHQLWMEFVFYLLSLVGMVEAARNPRKYWIWTLAAVAGQLLNFLISEYFLGIELTRPVILWLLFASAQKSQSIFPRLKKTILYWLPYLTVLLAYLVWRFVFLDLPGPDRNAPVVVSALLSAPLPTLLHLIQMAFQDFIYILITNWYNTLQPGLFDFSDRFGIFSLALGLFTAFLTGMTMLVFRQPPKTGQPGEHYYSIPLLLLGLIMTAIGPLPAWVTDRQVISGAWSDRLAVPAMLGASIALAGFIAWLVRSRKQGILLASLLIGLAVANNLRVTNDYRWARIQQNRFYWQLSWRAPDITPSTSIFAEAEVLPKTGLYSTAAGINIIYGSTGTSGELPYWFYSLTREFSHQIPELVSGIPLQTSFRQFSFQGRSQDSLIVYFQPANADCMRVLTPEDGNDPALSSVTRQSLSISNLERIQPNANRTILPASDLFGREPDHGWCYYFQKADLARQTGNWETVAALGDEAQNLGFTMENSQSNTPQEWIPFIEGYAHSGRWQDAQSITRLALAANPKMNARLCDAWQSAQESAPGLAQQQEVKNILSEIGCAGK